MGFSATLYIAEEKGESRLFAETSYFRLHALGHLLQELSLSDFLKFVHECLNESTISFENGSQVEFGKDVFYDSQLFKGYVRIYHDSEYCVTAGLEFWGILKAGTQLWLEHNLANQVSTAHLLDQEKPQVQHKLNEYSYQGIHLTRVIERFGQENPRQALESIVELHPGYYPVAPLEMWIDSLSFLAKSLVAKQQYIPRPENSVPIPKSIQAAIVEMLRIGRLWGARIPVELQSRLGDGSDLAHWYNQLIDYCDAYPAGNLPYPEPLGAIPFSVDWFRSVEAKSIDADKAFELMRKLETAWPSIKPDEPGQVEVTLDNLIYTLRVDWIDISRLGYQALLYRMDAD